MSKRITGSARLRQTPVDGGKTEDLAERDSTVTSVKREKDIETHFPFIPSNLFVF